MNDVKASHMSPYGEIRSEWSIKDNRLQLKVTIPVNTTAEIFVPSTGLALTVDGKELTVMEKELTADGKETAIDGKKPTVDGKKAEATVLANAPGANYHYLKLTKGSGTYLFETELNSDL